MRPDELTEHPSFDYPEWKLDPAGGFNALYRFAVTRRELFATVPAVPGASLTLRRLWTSNHIRIRIITFRLYFEFFHQVAIRQTIEWRLFGNERGAVGRIRERVAGVHQSEVVRRPQMEDPRGD